MLSSSETDLSDSEAHDEDTALPGNLINIAIIPPRTHSISSLLGDMEVGRQSD